MHSEASPGRGVVAGLAGGGPRPEAIVGIDPAKASALAGALGRTADRAEWQLAVAGRVLAEVGEDVGLLHPLRQFAVWCEAEQADVRATAEAVLTVEAGPPPPWLAGLGVHHDPDRAEYRAPVAAFDAATAAVAALASGDRDAFVDLADRWRANAVFAEVLFDRVGPSVVADAVSYLAALTVAGLGAERLQQQAVVSGLAAALDTARRAGVTDITRRLAGRRARPAPCR